MRTPPPDAIDYISPFVLDEAGFCIECTEVERRYARPKPPGVLDLGRDIEGDLRGTDLLGPDVDPLNCKGTLLQAPCSINSTKYRASCFSI